MSQRHATGDDRPAHREPPIRVSVVVDGPVEPIVGELRSAGMTVHDVLSALGIVTGEVATRHLEGLRAVPGVLAVEEERDLEAGPDQP